MAFFGDVLVESCFVVSADSKPGVLAPAAPVPVESPAGVFLVPLHAEIANTEEINKTMNDFFITVVLFITNKQA